MSEKPKTKHWKYRGGERKAVSFKLPIETIEKLDDMAETMNVSKTQVLIEAIDMKESVADLS